MGLATDRLPQFKGFIYLLLLTAVACRQSQGFIPRATPHAFPFTNPRHTLLSCTILLACLTSKPLFFRQSFTVSIHFFRGLPIERLPAYPYIDSLSNPVVLHSLHMAESSENTFINLLVHTQVVHLYSPNHKPLLLPPYHCLTTIRKNRH